jgi:hypothetical protein
VSGCLWHGLAKELRSQAAKNVWLPEFMQKNSVTSVLEA